MLSEVQEQAIALGKYEITPTGLQFYSALTLDEWIECGSQLIGVKNAIQWCIGDWLVYGEGRGAWGEMYAQAMGVTKISYETLRQYAWVSERFEFVTRVTILSWSHYRVVSGVDDKLERTRLLNMAVEKKMSSRDLDAHMKQLKGGVPRALQMSENNEWYTPSKYIEAARAVLGGFDLDPASCEYANRTVQAAGYFTEEDEGEKQDWYGRVWLNPPYGREEGESNQAVWSAKLIAEYEAGNVSEAVMLVNAVTDRVWFQPLWDYPICFTDHRIRFYNKETEAGQPTHGNVLVYFGENVQGFFENFRQFGRVVLPEGVMSVAMESRVVEA